MINYAKNTVLICLAIFLFGCEKPEQKKISSIDSLNAKEYIIGGETGSFSFEVAKKKLPNAKFADFQYRVDAYPALTTGKINAIVYDKPALDYVAKSQPEFMVLPETLAPGEIAIGGPFRSLELMKKVNDFIRQYREDGTYDDMYNRWVNTENPKIPHIPAPKNPVGSIRVGTDCLNEPMAYYGSDNVVTGFDIEFTKRLALYLNMKCEIVIMDYTALFPACTSGKIDLAVANMDATPERRETMIFSDQYIDSPVAILIRKQDYQSADGNLSVEEQAAINEQRPFWEDWKLSFERTFIREDRWKLIYLGLEVTIIISLCGALLGTILAFPLYFLSKSKFAVCRGFSNGYISLFQGTPILIILMILYYIIFSKVDINGVIVATLGFGLNFAAYVCEMLRSGIDSLPKGQTEASLALGLSKSSTFLKVILPQAVRQILPMYRGEFINMLKNTSIVGYIAIQDLTKMSDIIRSKTYEAFFPLIMTAIIYFIIAFLLTSFLSFIEYKLNPNSRRKKYLKGGTK